jgi:hypothetical protein
MTAILKTPRRIIRALISYSQSSPRLAAMEHVTIHPEFALALLAGVKPSIVPALVGTGLLFSI